MVPLGKIGDTVVQGITYIIKHRRMRRGSAIALFLLLFTLILYIDFFPSKVDLKVGDVAPYDIDAPRSTEYIDKIETEELRQQASEGVDDVYAVDLNIIVDVAANIDDLTEKIGSVQTDSNLNPAEKVKKLTNILPFTLAPQDLEAIATGTPEDTKEAGEVSKNLIADQMQPGIPDEALAEAEEEIIADLKGHEFAGSYQAYGAGLVKEYLSANRFYNKEQTELLRKQAMDAVEPVKVPIKAKQKIIKTGEIVTPQNIQELQALGLMQTKAPWMNFIGSILLTATLMAVVLFYTRQQNREIYRNIGQLYLLGFIALFVLVVSKMLLAIELSRWPELGEMVGYVTPVAAAGMLTAILLDNRLAVITVAVISLFMGLMTGELNFSLAGFIGGVIGVFSVTRLSQRSELVRGGLYTGIAVAISILFIGMIEDQPWRLLLISAPLLGLFNGLLSSILTNGALPYLESSFGITSSFKLLELSNPSHPLLRKLLLEAPGSYHHSIMVGNLAEAATEEVGGDQLLVRVGALYHDVGKIKRPYFFIENQLSGDNPHDKIAPNLSTLILTSHVKDGGDLAREYKLPQGVIDLVEQHHGTSLVRYFYGKALEGERADTVNEDDFRYDGPKPQTREAAIVMLADMVEAAVRAQNNPTSGQIEGLVRKLIKDTLMSGQLDECDLTFKDLDTIANAFLRVLSGVFHTRIEYPDIKEMERRKARRANHRK